MSLERFIEETNSASSSEEVFDLFQNALKRLGYDRICYSLITDHPSLDASAGHAIMKNYPDDFMKHYMRNGYEKIDPVPQHCFFTNKPFTWDWVVQKKELKLDQKKVMNEAEDAKLHNGIAVPIYGLNGEIAGVGMASSSGGINPDKNLLCLIRAFTMQFHLAYTELELKENDLRNVHLTEREKDILLWMIDGKSDSVIADILNISYNGVRFHIQNIYNKLQTNNRYLAQVKAIRYGLVLPTYVVMTPPGEVAN